MYLRGTMKFKHLFAYGWLRATIALLFANVPAFAGGEWSVDLSPTFKKLPYSINSCVSATKGGGSDSDRRSHKTSGGHSPLGEYAISPDGTRMAFSVNPNGEFSYRETSSISPADVAKDTLLTAEVKDGKLINFRTESLPKTLGEPGSTHITHSSFLGSVLQVGYRVESDARVHGSYLNSEAVFFYDLANRSKVSLSKMLQPKALKPNEKPLIPGTITHTKILAPGLFFVRATEVEYDKRKISQNGEDNFYLEKYATRNFFVVASVTRKSDNPLSRIELVIIDSKRVPFTLVGQRLDPNGMQFANDVHALVEKNSIYFDLGTNREGYTPVQRYFLNFPGLEVRNSNNGLIRPQHVNSRYPVILDPAKGRTPAMRSHVRSSLIVNGRFDYHLRVQADNHVFLADSSNSSIISRWNFNSRIISQPDSYALATNTGVIVGRRNDSGVFFLPYDDKAVTLTTLYLRNVRAYGNTVEGFVYNPQGSLKLVRFNLLDLESRRR